MTPPLLKLAFLQGPRDGESLEYKPGSTIRIGRVVRGNEIAVKDAGISTKHLRIVSDSENWIIHDLGSSNGTMLNSETLDPDTPVNLRHGDVIKLGECTSIVVSFETDDVEVEKEEERKLPPRRNNRRLPVSDPDPDRVAIESVQEKPKRRGRPRKKEKEVAVTSEEEGGNNNKQKREDLSLNRVVKLEVEDTTPKGVEMKRVTRSSRQMRRNVKCEDDVIIEEEEEKKRRPSSRPRAATRSTTNKKEIGGDSFQELEIVLNQARKVPESVEEEEMGAINEDEIGRGEASNKEDERVEIESKKSVIVGEEEKDNSKGGGVETSSDGGGCDKEEKAEQGSRNVVELEKMTLGDWFEYMKVHLRKRIVDKTEKMIEDMRSKSLRVQHHIAEQKQAKGKGSVS